MIVKQMEEQASNEITNAYKALAEAAGAEFDEGNVETYLKELIDRCMEVYVDRNTEKADMWLSKLQNKITYLEGRVTEARNKCNATQKEAKEFETELRIIKGREESNFREDCRRISQENKPCEGVNPFHDAVDDFLNQLEAHSITGESKGQALASFINSMGYLYWQNAKIAEKDKQEYGKW